MNQEELTLLGKAIRAMREARDMKQEDLAHAAEITRPMLSAYERGRVQPTLDTLERLLKAMEATLADLQEYREYVGLHHPHHRKTPPQRLTERREVVEDETTPSAAEAMQAVLKAVETWLNASLRAHQANQESPPQTPLESPEET